MPDQKPQIDLTAIAFPSDKLSFGMLRKQFPAFFGQVRDSNQGQVAEIEWFMNDYENDVEPLMKMERHFAIEAFNDVVGRKTDGTFFGGQEDLLSDSLQKYGLASGPNHAEQLIRDIKDQARIQAEALCPPPPRP